MEAFFDPAEEILTEIASGISRGQGGFKGN